MKKILILLMALLMCFGFGLVGCGEYKPPVDPGTSDMPNKNPSNGENKPPESEKRVFTVSLIYNNAAFAPKTEIEAIWTEIGGFAVYTAKFDDKGVASVEGLDGDFKVTISALPEGYTYDPNVYVATNTDHDVRISLFKIIETKRTQSIRSNISGISGNLVFNIAEERGAYRAVINRANEEIRFTYNTTQYGVYSIQSVVDVTSNVVNPTLSVYTGGVNQGLFGRETYEDGGTINTYTKNVKYSTALDRGWLIIFGISATSLNSTYPVTVDFIIEKDGELTGGDVYDKVEPVEEFKQTPEYSQPFRFAASLRTKNVLDASFFALNPEDGYYHFYDEETDTYGGILYSKINKDWQVTATESRMGFMDGKVAKRFNGKDYTSFIEKYSRYVNSDGVYAVTEELKEFLQQFSISQGYFMDGDGWAEKYGGYNSSETNQWLFSCGFYNRF